MPWQHPAFGALLTLLPTQPEPPVLELDLPDPDQDDISTMEFLARLEQAWAVCDKFDLQTEIWRGRILKAVRDREKRGGEGRGAGFLQWSVSYTHLTLPTIAKV